MLAIFSFLILLLPVFTAISALLAQRMFEMHHKPMHECIQVLVHGIQDNYFHYAWLCFIYFFTYLWFHSFETASIWLKKDLKCMKNDEITLVE